MKNARYFIFLITIFLFAGCSKDNPVENNNNDIAGDWILVKLSGSIVGSTIPVTDNNMNVLKISDNGSFKIWTKNNPTVTTKYEIKKLKTIYSEEPMDCIVLSDSSISPNKYVISQHTKTNLILRDNIFDGYEMVYERAVYVCKQN